MNPRTIFTTSLLIILFAACKSSQNSKAVLQEAELEQIMKDKFNSEAEMVLNETGDYALMYSFIKNRPNDISPTLHYLIVDTNTAKELIEERVARATISWSSKWVVYVKIEKPIPGPDGKEPRDLSYNYHVKNDKKFGKNSWKK